MHGDLLELLCIYYFFDIIVFVSDFKDIHMQTKGILNTYSITRQVQQDNK